MANSAQLVRPRCWLQNWPHAQASTAAAWSHGGLFAGKEKLTSGPGTAAPLIAQLAAKDTFMDTQLSGPQVLGFLGTRSAAKLRKNEVENNWHVLLPRKKRELQLAAELHRDRMAARTSFLLITK
jgi:hypothetical protein